MRKLAIVALYFVLLCELVFTGGDYATAYDPEVLHDNLVDPQYSLVDCKLEILNSINSLYNNTNQNLWIIFVPTFTGIEENFNYDNVVDAQNWIQQLANVNKLGPNDIVFAVATSTHEMAVWISGQSTMLKQRNVRVIINTVLPFLRQGQWGEAVLKFIESTQNQIDTNQNFMPYIFVCILFLALVAFLVYCSQKRIKQVSESDQEANSLNKTLNNNEIVGIALEPDLTVLKPDFLVHPTPKPLNIAITPDVSVEKQISTVDDLALKYGSNQQDEGNESVRTVDIYSDYYTRNPSREVYGSYYSEGQAAKHDQQVNKFMYDRYNYATQSYTSLQKTDTKELADIDKLMDKYYQENTSKIDDIQKRIKKWTQSDQ